MRALSRYLDLQDIVCRTAVVALMITVLGSVSAGMFWRSFLDSTLPWSGELARSCLIWTAFLGSPVVLRRNGHVALELIVQALSERYARLMQVAILLIVISVTVIMFWAGWKLASNARMQVSSTLPVTLMVIYLSIPIGSAAMSLVALEGILKQLFAVPSTIPRGQLPDTGE